MDIRLALQSETDYLVDQVERLYPDDICPKHQLRKILASNPAWVIVDKRIKAHLISEVSKGTPYIWSVAVDPDYRRRGAATTLLQEFEKHYKQSYESGWLHCRVENPAQKLYFDQGYRIASFEPNIYGARQHGVTMRKRFV